MHYCGLKRFFKGKNKRCCVDKFNCPALSFLPQGNHSLATAKCRNAYIRGGSCFKRVLSRYKAPILQGRPALTTARCRLPL